MAVPMCYKGQKRNKKDQVNQDRKWARRHWVEILKKLKATIAIERNAVRLVLLQEVFDADLAYARKYGVTAKMI